MIGSTLNYGEHGSSHCPRTEDDGFLKVMSRFIGKSASGSPIVIDRDIFENEPLKSSELSSIRPYSDRSNAQQTEQMMAQRDRRGS
jgi:hypothetical protein